MSKPRVADRIAEKLETIISQGNFAIGDRLPSERALAEQLAVSRPTVREAIQKLISKGMLVSRPGGGTFVRNSSAPSFVDPVLELFKENPEYRFDVLEIRHALEGNAAWYAALRATDEDKQKIKRCFDEMIACHGAENPMDEARADMAFHLSIVEASHNVVLLYIMRGLFDLLQNSISHNLDKLYTIHRVFNPLSKQHETLMEAILKSDPEAARRAAQEHLAFVEDSLKKIDEEEARKIRSLRSLTILGEG